MNRDGLRPPPTDPSGSAGVFTSHGALADPNARPGAGQATAPRLVRTHSVNRGIPQPQPPTLSQFPRHAARSGPGLARSKHSVVFDDNPPPVPPLPPMPPLPMASNASQSFARSIASEQPMDVQSSQGVHSNHDRNEPPSSDLSRSKLGSDMHVDRPSDPTDFRKNDSKAISEKEDGGTQFDEDFLRVQSFADKVWEVMVSVLFTMTHGNNPNWLVEMFSIVVEDLQMYTFFISYGVAPAYWIPVMLADVSGANYSYLSVRRIYLAMTLVSLAAIFSLLANAAYVAYGFIKGEHKYIWPIKTLRFLATILPTVLFIPCVEVLTAVLTCNKISTYSYSSYSSPASPVTVADVGDDFVTISADSSGSYAAAYGSPDTLKTMSCGENFRLGLVLASCTALLLYIPVSVLVTSAFYEADPARHHPCNKAHAKVDTMYIMLKTIVVGVYRFSPDSFSAVKAGTALAMALIMYGATRAGFYMSSVFVGVVSFVSTILHANGSTAPRPAFHIMIGVLPVGYAAGFFLSSYLLERTQTTCVERIRMYTKLLEAQGGPPKKRVWVGVDVGVHVGNSDVLEQGQSVFRNWPHVEIAARMAIREYKKGLLSKESTVDLIEAIFERGLDEFSSFSQVYLSYALYVHHLLPNKTEKVNELLSKARLLLPTFEEKVQQLFLDRINFFAKEAEMLGLHAQLDVTTYASFQRMNFDAKRFHRNAVRETARMWKLLLDRNLEIDELYDVCMVLFWCIESAEQSYCYLLRKFPNAIAVAKGMAAFCKDILSDESRTSELNNLVQSLESLRSQRMFNRHSGAGNSHSESGLGRIHSASAHKLGHGGNSFFSRSMQIIKNESGMSLAHAGGEQGNTVSGSNFKLSSRKLKNVGVKANNVVQKALEKSGKKVFETRDKQAKNRIWKKKVRLAKIATVGAHAFALCLIGIAFFVPPLISVDSAEFVTSVFGFYSQSLAMSRIYRGIKQLEYLSFPNTTTNNAYEVFNRDYKTVLGTIYTDLQKLDEGNLRIIKFKRWNEIADPCWAWSATQEHIVYNKPQVLDLVMDFLLIGPALENSTAKDFPVRMNSTSIKDSLTAYNRMLRFYDCLTSKIPDFEESQARRSNIVFGMMIGTRFMSLVGLVFMVNFLVMRMELSQKRILNLMKVIPPYAIRSQLTTLDNSVSHKVFAVQETGMEAPTLLPWPLPRIRLVFALLPIISLALDSGLAASWVAEEKTVRNNLKSTMIISGLPSATFKVLVTATEMWSARYGPGDRAMGVVWTNEFKQASEYIRKDIETVIAIAAQLDSQSMFGLGNTVSAMDDVSPMIASTATNLMLTTMGSFEITLTLAAIVDTLDTLREAKPIWYQSLARLERLMYEGRQLEEWESAAQELEPVMVSALERAERTRLALFASVIGLSLVVLLSQLALLGLMVKRIGSIEKGMLDVMRRLPDEVKQLPQLRLLINSRVGGGSGGGGGGKKPQVRRQAMAVGDDLFSDDEPSSSGGGAAPADGSIPASVIARGRRKAFAVPNAGGADDTDWNAAAEAVAAAAASSAAEVNEVVEEEMTGGPERRGTIRKSLAALFAAVGLNGDGELPPPPASPRRGSEDAGEAKGMLGRRGTVRKSLAMLFGGGGGGEQSDHEENARAFKSSFGLSEVGRKSSLARRASMAGGLEAGRGAGISKSYAKLFATGDGSDADEPPPPVPKLPRRVSGRPSASTGSLEGSDAGPIGSRGSIGRRGTLRQSLAALSSGRVSVDEETEEEMLMEDRRHPITVSSSAHDVYVSVNDVFASGSGSTVSGGHRSAAQRRSTLRKSLAGLSMPGIAVEEESDEAPPPVPPLTHASGPRRSIASSGSAADIASTSKGGAGKRGSVSSGLRKSLAAISAAAIDDPVEEEDDDESRPAVMPLPSRSLWRVDASATAAASSSAHAGEVFSVSTRASLSKRGSVLRKSMGALVAAASVRVEDADEEDPVPPLPENLRKQK
ncbi:hypothetical protein HDU96_003390 [Phlyctochytrium bullatum]|nr:hypothetical protein HDU96_003390 [Phlyctochytrium bullatum]